MKNTKIIVKTAPVKFAGEEDLVPPKATRISGWRIQRRPALWRPPTDVFETETKYVVVVEVAGMRGNEFSVTLEKGFLSIQGVRADKSGLKAYHQMEIAYGEFISEVRLPTKINAEKVEAAYIDGFLRVVLPKSQPKTISIED
jgi:HSP20 family protein